MSYRYHDMHFDTVADAKRASVSMFLQADSPDEAPELDFDDANTLNELAREMVDTGWKIACEGTVCVDRARTLILDWRGE